MSAAATFPTSDWSNCKKGFVSSVKQNPFAKNIAFLDVYNYYNSLFLKDELEKFENALSELVFPKNKRFINIDGHKLDKIKLSERTYDTFHRMVTRIYSEFCGQNVQHLNVIYTQNGCQILCMDCEDVNQDILFKTLYNNVKTSILVNSIIVSIVAWKKLEKHFRKEQLHDLSEFSKVNHEKLMSLIKSSKCKLSNEEKQAIELIVN